MALKLIANYSKRLGLPGYSSHQFSVCVETEISSIDDVAGESSRLYQTLQQSVDEQRPRPETMQTILETVQSEFGGATGWLAQQGWTTADIDRLRARLTT